MSAPDESLLRRASPAYRAAVLAERGGKGEANPAPAQRAPSAPVQPVSVAGYTLNPRRWMRRLTDRGDCHSPVTAVEVSLLLVSGERVCLSLSPSTARSLAADLAQATLPLSSRRSAVCMTAGNGP